MAKPLTNFVKSLGQVVGGGAGSLIEFVAPPDAFGATGCNYARDFQTWCVPPGISSAKIQLWGAGGQAGGWAGAACAVSPPASSGAFAEKIITVTPGECYQIHIGRGHCSTSCANPQDMYDNDGTPSWNCSTWVAGTGLTNFCAEGGKHACTITGTSACANALFPDSSTLVWNDSENAPQAKYYGADRGVEGVNGYMKWDKGPNTDALCNVRWYVPFPACLVNKQGGHVVVTSCCYYPNRQWYGSKIQSQLFQPNMPDATIPPASLTLPGVGAPGMNNCNSCNACGATNQFGKVRIFYS